MRVSERATKWQAWLRPGRATAWIRVTSMTIQWCRDCTRFWLLLTIALLAAPTWSEPSKPSRPNFLLVLLDDADFSDLGVFGSEIRTPTIDALAKGGMVFTEFHAAPTCSPTRAMLLSGVDSHLAGLGSMYEELAPNQVGKPGYEGYLNFSVAALPEVFQEAGYNTYMTGKWHLGLTPETSPSARGFDHSFAMLQAGAGAFGNMMPMVGPGKAMYLEDGEMLEELPGDFYTTAFYTDKLISYLQGGETSGRPFFAYLAYTAPHWPLQAPDESIARYRDVYKEGYDKLRRTRHKKLQELGLVSHTVLPSKRLPGEPSWDELSEQQKKLEARKMEIYAAMVDDVDRYLGRLVAYLKETGQFQNTVIVVLSDNGPEGHHVNRGWTALEQWVESCCDNSLENLGGADSYTWYGPNWGLAGNSPMRMYKGFTSQGGVRVPALLHYPGVVAAGSESGAIISVMDLMPTLLDIANIEPPSSRFKGRSVHKIQGKSMLPLIKGEADSIRGSDDFIAWELFGKRALRRGEWKIVYEPFHPILEPRPEGIKTNAWQLYNLVLDPSESHDLGEKYPVLLSELIALWDKYAQENGVILPSESSGY